MSNRTRNSPTEHGLPFTILADPSKQTAKDYGVLKKYCSDMELASRETFLIDPQGKIVKHYPSRGSEGALAGRAQ